MFTPCVCVSAQDASVAYLVYKLLHPLHGVVSLQQWSHPHETFITAPVILFLLLLSFLSSVILFVYSSVLVALRDTLRGEKTDIIGAVGLEMTGRLTPPGTLCLSRQKNFLSSKKKKKKKVK